MITNKTNDMALYSVIQIEREDIDSPVVKFVNALGEEQALEKFADLTGYTVDELTEGEENGEIVIFINECVESRPE